MTIYEMPETQITADARGNMLTFTGTWGTTANAAYSSGSAQVSSTVGDKVTVKWTGRALWLLTEQNATSGTFSLTIDGVALPGVIIMGGAVQMYKVFQPIFRAAPGAGNAAHTSILTVVSGSITVDSLIIVSDALLQPTPGVLVCLGDSVALGNGSTDPTRFSYAARLAMLLGTRSAPGITLINKGLGSDNLYCKDATHAGGMYRMITDVIPNAPHFLTVNFGINDIYTNGGQATDFFRQYMALLQFIEDTMDTTQVIVAVGTPTPATPLFFGVSPSTSGSKDDNYLMAVAATRIAVQSFGWCRLADLHAVIETHDSFNIPNFTGVTFDVHPNDAGHGAAALEFYRAMTATDSGMY